MLFVDVNVLVNVFRVDGPHHQPVRGWFDSARVGHEALGLLPETAAAFVRVVTNRRIWKVPASTPDAMAFIDAVVDSPSVRWLQPGGRQWPIFVDLVHELNLSGDDIADAYLAAAALEAGATLVTSDRGFLRFRSLRILDPRKPS